MNIENVSIGLEVVRVKGDYVVGRTGKIVEVVGKNRVRVDWDNAPKSQVDVSVIEPTSIPYEITEGYCSPTLKDKYGRTKYINPAYRRL